MLTKKWIIQCDDCGYFTYVFFDTKRDAIEKIRSDGWQLRRKHQLRCPNCAVKHESGR